VAAVREALCGACWADGGPNPLCPVLARRENGCGPGRRVCCLRFRLPGVDACGDCPRARSAAGCPARTAG
jgi:ferric iron reductase protein FhuF